MTENREMVPFYTDETLNEKSKINYEVNEKSIFNQNEE
jgi:hypothetical protein